MAETTLSGVRAAGGRGARPTMRDVAALAGVSLKTVSRVVNDEPGVSAGVRERVRAAAERLDYRPNLAASFLRSADGRTGVIGALVQDVSNSFSAGMLRAIEETARAHSTSLLAASLDEAADREELIVRSLVRRRVDGLVITPATARQEYLLSEVRAGLPIVVVDREPRGIDVDSVTVDNVEGAARAVGHLLDHGHRRIAVITDREGIATAEHRRRGAELAHERRGIACDPSLFARAGSEQEATQVVRGFLASGASPASADPGDRPTAVFGARNVIAAGAARALADLWMRDRIALVGFDDFPLADLLVPALTVVRQDAGRIGRSAAELLFSRIEGHSGPPRHIVYECELIARGSGELPPAW